MGEFGIIISIILAIAFYVFLVVIGCAPTAVDALIIGLIAGLLSVHLD